MILIVDDYNTMIRIIRNLLRSSVSSIDDAADGSAALQEMRSRRNTGSSSPTGTWSR
jgi:two-component system, chemotaxis family, chemotaxis protein CheY